MLFDPKKIFIEIENIPKKNKKNDTQKSVQDKKVKYICLIKKVIQ